MAEAALGGGVLEAKVDLTKVAEKAYDDMTDALKDCIQAIKKGGYESSASAREVDKATKEKYGCYTGSDMNKISGWVFTEEWSSRLFAYPFAADEGRKWTSLQKAMDVKARWRCDRIVMDRWGKEWACDGWGTAKNTIRRAANMYIARQYELEGMEMKPTPDTMAELLKKANETKKK